MTFEKQNFNLGEEEIEPMYQCKCDDAEVSKNNFSSAYRCGGSSPS